MKQTLLGALGIALFLALWEIVGRTQILGISWPPLSDVLEMLTEPARRPLFQRAIGATLDSTGARLSLGCQHRPFPRNGGASPAGAAPRLGPAGGRA
jgi:ABC-type nitrate/sulfonate/bicarbonate transport system permease component